MCAAAGAGSVGGMSTASYPARLEGRLDPQLNRWLWLVKWVLVIPHLLVLAFLWIAFVVLSVAAFFSILFTGRYPRSIFDFNLGVMRWTWRVSFYSYSALGTDQYPPFTLADVPDYPARVDVTYPERLSRGLVLVKWLLGIPHYLIVGFFAGGGVWALTALDEHMWPGGLVSLLVLVAGAMLLVTGVYPQQIFDFVLGLNRWVMRVSAYAALMTDVYAPFRLDQGGDDPGAFEVAPPAAKAAPRAPAEPWGPGRVLLVLFGGLAGLVALGLALGALAVVWADQTQRDGDGYLMTPTELVGTDTYALVSERVTIEDLDGPDWAYADDLLGTVRLRAESDGPLFLGIARTADAEAYLGGIEHETVTDLPSDDYRLHAGGRPTVDPASSEIWVASTAGSGEQTLNWEVREGDWSVVAMRPDGTRGVEADVSIGARLDDLGWLAIGLGAAALLSSLVTAAFLVGAFKGRRA